MKFRTILSQNSVHFHILIILISIEMLMSFSFLGYMHTDFISITFAYIPVLVAGAIYGVPDAVTVGAVFGLASMWKAGANYVQDADKLFSPFMSGSPIESILLSVGCRMLFGLIIGVLYFLAKRTKFTWFWVALISFFGKFIHSAVVYGCMGMFFPESGYDIGSAIAGLGNVSDLAANFVTCIIVTAIWQLERTAAWRRFSRKLQKAHEQSGGNYSSHRFLISAAVVLTLILSMFVGIYFVDRMNYALEKGGVVLSDANYYDLLHLQIQFLFGILSMMMILAVCMMFVRQYTVYMSYEANTDALTGLMTRAAFFPACRRAVDNNDGDEVRGYFLIIDADHFKQINDKYGHPQGDKALRSIARQLWAVFGTYGLVGRLGGDEFAVLLQKPITREALESEIKRFVRRINDVKIEEYSLSCSIGAAEATADKTIDELYREADGALYRAKNTGRGQYVFSDTETECRVTE